MSNFFSALYVDTTFNTGTCLKYQQNYMGLF